MGVEKNIFGNFVEKAKESVQNIDVEALKEKANLTSETLSENAAKASEYLTEKAGDIKDSAMLVKEDITNKLTELDQMLQSSITEYNDAYTLMNDKGVRLYVERSRAVDAISLVEELVNSIANKPKSFETELEEIATSRDKFVDSVEFADKELKAAREAAGSAGAGVAAGAAVAFMAPTAAMWIATTFGTASTGAAISTLSGAAATNAALAWLGGGAVAAGGGGMAAGNAFLALAGPIGWTIAGATLLSSILIFTAKRTKLNKEKSEEIEVIKRNIEAIKEMDGQINMILEETISLRNGVKKSCVECLSLFDGDYTSFTEEQKLRLGAIVNNTKALAVSMGKNVVQETIDAE